MKRLPEVLELIRELVARIGKITTASHSSVWSFSSDRTRETLFAIISNHSAANMRADLSTTDIIRIQVVSRLSDLLFDDLQKINLDGAPLNARRVHLTAIENAAAIQRAVIDLLQGIPERIPLRLKIIKQAKMAYMPTLIGV